jgi:hypothetical protein
MYGCLLKFPARDYFFSLRFYGLGPYETGGDTFCMLSGSYESLK